MAGFAGFIFGNLDEEGEVEEGGVLDKNEIAQLSRLGVLNMDDIDEQRAAFGDSGGGQQDEYDDEEEDDEHYHGKTSSEQAGMDAPASVDYADIDELVDDSESLEKERLYQKGIQMMTHTKESTDDDYDDYDEDDGSAHLITSATESMSTSSDTPSTATPTTSLSWMSQSVTSTIVMPKTDSNNTSSPVQESQLMELSDSSISQSDSSQVMNEVAAVEAPPLPGGLTKEELLIKVKQLFPGFTPSGILRFSSLLGPGKQSSLPRPWEGCRKPKPRTKSPSDVTDPNEWTFNFAPIPNEDMLDDDEVHFNAPVDTLEGGGEGKTGGDSVGVDEETSEWRFGPAKYWYDLFGVPKDGRGFDYGFKLKAPPTDDSMGVSPPEVDPCVPEDAFLMVTQRQWEDDVIIDSTPSLTVPVTAQGGFWTAIDTSLKHLPPTTTMAASSSNTVLTSSIFPIENPELVYRRWEDDIILDSENVSHIPRPCLPRLDPNDPKMVIGLPEEPAPLTDNTPKDTKKDVKKSKQWSNKFGKSGEPPPTSQSIPFAKKDPFNLSNDEYYNPKHATSSQGLSGIDSSNVVQHSIPALDLHLPWFPTHWSAHALRHFHRPRFKIKCNSDTTGWIPILTLNKLITKKDKEREKERVLSGGGEVFFMRTPEDLSACDGHVTLVEYSEEHPPLVMATGMGTKIKNYYRRPEKIKGGPPSFKYGETTYIQSTSYFLGDLKPGQSLQSFENNLYRAPVYLHKTNGSDFLIIRSENKYYIRGIDDVFLVGQTCPKVEVPAPNSKTANQFQKDYLQVYLYRLFQESDDNPKKLKMEMVRRAFPTSVMSESVIRKVLKQLADFKREGYDSGSWVLRSDVRLPTEEEMRAMVTPEQTCAFFSMLAAEQRLKDAGYGGKSLFAVEDDEEDDSSQKIDDEVRAAPWNTTHHFINAMKGKYQLSVSGPADPTGCGEGFSYTRLNTKESTTPGIPASKRAKPVTGTDADLRKLKLSKARTVLRNFGVSEEEISKLSRWKVIDLVRTISTEAAKSGGSVDVSSLMFARGTRFSQMEAQERYKEDCQRVFDLQNKVLVSDEILSTDEDSSDSGGESEDELGRNLESLLFNKKTAVDLTHEQEEAERQELRRLLMEDQPVSSRSSEVIGEDRATPVGDADDTSSVLSTSSLTGRRLVISRTFKDDEGREYTRHEVVKNQGVIDAYVRIMSGSKDKDIRMEFAEKDEQTKEDIKKEVKRIRNAIKQLDKQEEKAKNKPPKPKKEKFTAMHLTCSVCGQKGHMKTNKNCPMYKNQPVQVALTDAELQAQNPTTLPQDDLVKVEGTKVVLKKDLIEHAEDVRRKSLVLRVPKDKVRKRKKHGDEPLDYLEKRAKSGQRRRTNPEVPFSAILEKVVNKLSTLSEFWAFCKPVSAKTVPDYYNLIKFPMDLQTMKENIRKHVYETREQFKEHINLIVNNCITYNGFNSDITRNAKKMLEFCCEEMKQYDKELEQLEREINPLLGDDPQAALSFLFRKSIEKMTSVPNSRPFHFPVNSKKLPDYHMIITKPMDLETLRKNCENDKYRSQEEFLFDLNQIVENSITYNGPTSTFTLSADIMRQMGISYLEEKADLLSQYEAQIASGEYSKSPTTSSLQDSSMDVLEEQHSSLLISDEESNQTGITVTSVGGATGGGIVEGSGLTVVTVEEAESMVLDSGQVPLGADEIDVESFDDIDVGGTRLPVGPDPIGVVGEGGASIDQMLLMQDLAHSSSSSEEDEDEFEDILPPSLGD